MPSQVKTRAAVENLIPSSISTIQLSDRKSLVYDSPAAAELMISFTKTENFQMKKPKKYKQHTQTIN